MKNISLILNIVLLLAVAYLYVDRFAASGADEKPAATEEAKDEPLRIVYLNIDSLHEKSETFQTKKAEIEKRQAEAEASLTSRAKAFEKEVIAFQQKYQSGTMTPKAAEDEQTRLARKEQSIMAERERLATDLMQETDDFNLAFTNKVKGYLDSLKTQMNYDYILVAGSGSPVLLANDSLDITKTVLDMLNKKN